MSFDIWENLVALNSAAPPVEDSLQSASSYSQLGRASIKWDESRLPLDLALSRDPHPLPTTKNREGYYGENHFAYWLSGLQLYQVLTDYAKGAGVQLQAYLDIGCATGRTLRHFACQTNDIDVYGCDINRQHVDWIMKFLPQNVVAFQNHSIPNIPLPDNSIDLITALSVFTHIETWDTAWLMEIKRILRPGGIAWLTFHSDDTWKEMNESWPLYKALQKYPSFSQFEGKDLPTDFTVFRHKSDKSYSSNVFIKNDYIRRVWGRVIPIREIKRRFPVYQDLVILQKG